MITTWLGRKSPSASIQKSPILLFPTWWLPGLRDVCLREWPSHEPTTRVRGWSNVIVDFSLAVANSRFRGSRKRNSAWYQKLRVRTRGDSTHQADIYQSRKYNLIRHRGNRWYRAGRPSGLVVGLHWNTTTVQTSILLLKLALVVLINNYRREIFWRNFFASIKWKQGLNNSWDRQFIPA